MNTPQIIAALSRAFHQPAVVANPCEVITACSVCGRTSAWCTCIGTYAFPRAGEGEQQGAAHGDAELDGAALPAGMILNFHERSNTDVG
jgi:hypothetical protein